MSEHRPRPVLVVGVGSLDAGDDAAGPRVASAVARLRLPTVEVIAHEDPTDLPLVWSGRHTVIVVDAVLSGAPAGTVRVLTIPHSPAGLADRSEAGARTWPDVPARGSHDFGLPTAIALSRVLGTLPDDLIVVGIEGSHVDPLRPMSRATELAIGDAVERIIELVAAHAATQLSATTSCLD